MEISVLMATHNPNREFLKKSIQSILEQTYDKFEFIIVDDGSDESVEQMINTLGIEDERMKIVRSSTNLGLPKALNLGVRYCNGNYIARMDDDDISLKNRLEQQLDYVKRNNLVGCWCGADRINEKNQIIRVKEKDIKSKKILEQLIRKGNIFCHTSLFIKRDIVNEVGGYDENLRYAQDNDLYIRIVQKNNMGYIAKSLVKFRINNERKSIYKDSFSLICSLFPVYKFYLESNDIKSKIWVIERFIRFLIFSLFIYKKNNNTM